MAQPKHDPRKERDDEAESEVTRAMQKRFNEIQYDYVQALQDVQAAASKGHEDAHRTYEHSVRNAQLAAQKATVEIQQSFLQESNLALAQGVPESQQGEAFQKHITALSKPGLAAQESCIAAYDKCGQSVSAIQAEAKERSANAYRNYVVALREWWTRSEAEVIDAESLAAIAQTITAAAFHTLRTLENAELDISRPAAGK